MDLAARRNGASTLSPVREDASKKCTSDDVANSKPIINPREAESVPFSAAHRLASAHSTSLSSSRSDLFPTRTVTRCGLAKARASASHRDRFINESRLLSYWVK